VTEINMLDYTQVAEFCDF